ncbi:MAG: hypothetical protein H6706_25420 [Myxococcales bacterium]|nr:hypothetical protein [Myxococcales bacterium]
MSRLACFALLALVAGCAPAAAPTGRIALPLDVDVLPAADAVDLRVLAAGAEESSHHLTPPWGEPPLLEVTPGDDRVITLEASVGGVPYAIGESAPVTVEAGTTVDVEVVVDLVGVLEVRPLGILPGQVTGVLAEALDRPAGFLPLTADGDAFTATLPVGRYALQFGLADAILDFVPAASVEVEVAAGVRRTWAEPLIGPADPLPLPGVAVRLELEVPGGALLGGLLPVAADVIVRARDAEGRVATGYRGEVRFLTEGLAGLLPAALVPDPYRFGEQDAGVHTFSGALQAAVSLLTGTLRLTVSDDGGLTASLDLPVLSR